jgi:hypothetical protein
MPIERVKHYTRAEIQANPMKLYVFGDNLEGWGTGGQAKECRGEWNTVGIPTKKSPHAYFDDNDMEVARPFIWNKFSLLQGQLDKGRTVVIPEAGVGTGLAKLPEKAPAIFAFIQQCFERLEMLEKERE